MNATEQRTEVLARVTSARSALSRVHTAAAERPPMGLVAEAAHLERLVEAWDELAEAAKAAAQSFTEPSPPFVGLMAQHVKSAQQADRLRAELAVKQAEVSARLARVRGER